MILKGIAQAGVQNDFFGFSESLESDCFFSFTSPRKSIVVFEYFQSIAFGSSPRCFAAAIIISSFNLGSQPDKYFFGYSNSFITGNFEPLFPIAIRISILYL
jgi:hypothetical protein